MIILMTDDRCQVTKCATTCSTTKQLQNIRDLCNRLDENTLAKQRASRPQALSEIVAECTCAHCTPH